MAHDGMTEAGLAGPSRSGVAAMLVGRERELGLIASFLDHAAAEGAALLFSGEPGVGKTVLLAATAEAAAAAGIQVLRAAGEEFESEAKFSGLSQLLAPVLGELRQLSDLYQRSLSVALRFDHGLPADRLVVSNAVLALLRQARIARPVLIVVDDLQWLDRSSAVVLGLVTRRLAGSRIGFLAASRSEEGGFFERGGLPRHEIQPLDEAAAARLIEARFPELAARVRQRVLAEAQGNPLALLELPAALSGPQRSATQGLPALLPVNQRLQALFASGSAICPGRPVGCSCWLRSMAAAISASCKQQVKTASATFLRRSRHGWFGSIRAAAGLCSATRLSGPPWWGSRLATTAAGRTECWPTSWRISPNAAPGTSAKRLSSLMSRSRTCSKR